MKRYLSLQSVRVRLGAVLLVVCGIVSAAPAQEAGQPLDEDELCLRLGCLEQELAAEREALDAARKLCERELAERSAARRELAQQLLDKRIELEQLKTRREALRAEADVLSAESTDLRDAVKALLKSARTAAECLDIRLSEIPAGERYAADVRRALEYLPEDPDAIEPEALLSNLRLLVEALDRAHRDATSVRVERVKTRTARGLLEDVKLLSVGHVAFAYERIEGGRVGLALSSPADASGYRWTEALSGSVARQVRRAIREVESGGSGLVAVPMDVTGRLRVDALLPRETLGSWLRAGGPVMFPLAAVAILALVLIVERAWWLYLRNADKGTLVERALAACGEREYEEAERLLGEADGVVVRTLAACVRRRDQGARAMEDAIQEHLLHELPRLRRFLSGLAILAVVAPLLGLLGTVTGIITTFGVIRAFGNANPGLMAGGISEALNTTVAGLVIAIPILLARGVLRGRMEKIVGDTEKHAATVLNMLSRDG